MTSKLELVKIEALEPGKRVLLEGEFTKKEMKTKNGDPYLLVFIKDNTGSASQAVWSNLPIYNEIEGLESGQKVRAEVVCTKNSQYINIEVQSIQAIEEEPKNVVNIEALQEELREVIKTIKDEDLKVLITNVFNREDVKEAFWKAPASQKSAYSFEGGLATHVVRLTRLVKAITPVFNQWNHNLDGIHTKLNTDLLLTACILHDVGKIYALKKEGYNVEKTDEGKLFEDSYLTLKIVLEELEKIDLPEYQQMILEHVLASAKGKPGYGALNIPRSREAIAFHLIDTLDVQMAQFEYLDRESDVVDMFSFLFDKQVFLGIYDEE